MNLKGYLTGRNDADMPAIYRDLEAGFHKRHIRELAEALGLENAQKPQAACLSSRFPYGSHITEARLEQVERAEDVLASLGFTQYRVRHHEEHLRRGGVAGDRPLDGASHE